MSDYSVLIKKKIGFSLLGGLCILSHSCRQENKERDDNKLNILFLLADDLRWNSLGCMGNTMLHTENIDDLSRNGIRFTNTRVTTSISMVSRATILTGQYMSRHNIREFGVPLSEEAFLQTYPEVLRRAGYWSGFVGKYGIGTIREKDFDFCREYERIHWFPLENGDSIHVTERNKRDALEFLQGRPKDKPFVLSVSFLHLMPRIITPTSTGISLKVKNSTGTLSYRFRKQLRMTISTRFRIFWPLMRMREEKDGTGGLILPKNTRHT